MKQVASAPQGLDDLTGNVTDSYRVAAQLLRDPRSDEMWRFVRRRVRREGREDVEARFTSAGRHLIGIMIAAFGHARGARSEWDRMTHDERARWKKDFKSTLDSMVELLKRAPAIGITQEVPEFHIDAITDMGEEMLADVSLQSLSKPRDPDAQQARFVIAAAAGCAAILGWTRGTTLLISVCGSILFDDELSERTVRRWLAKPIPFDYGQISR